MHGLIGDSQEVLEDNMRGRILFLLGISTLATGCFATRLTQTAEPVGEGLSELSLSMNSTQITSFAGEDVGGFWPNLIPNVHYALGISDTMDFFGNVSGASWYGELGIKLALVQSESGTFSVAPSVGLSPLGPLASTRTTLPLLYTHRVSDKVALTAMGEVTYRHRGDVSATESGGEIAGTFQGNTLGIGGGLGVEVRNRNFYVRPALTYTHYNASFAGAEDEQEIGLAQVAFTFGRIGGKTGAQLDRIEQKLDAMNE